MEGNSPAEIGQFTLLELFELSFDPMCIVRRNGLFVLVNAAFRKILGNQDLSDKSILDFIHPDDSQAVSDAAYHANKNRTIQTIAFRLVGTNGNYLWFLWKFYPKEDGFIYVVAKDITPFQQLETAEQARVQFAEALLDTVLTINNNNLTLDIVLQRILSNIVKVVSFNHVSIMLIEENQAVLAASQNVGGISAPEVDTARFSLPVEDYYYLSVMTNTRAPVIVHDIATDQHWAFPPGIDFVGSYLGCPVVVDGEVIAFINVVKLQSNFYTSIHAPQLMMFANHVAIAIKNAYMFEQAEVAAALNERQRLARELHDSVNQILFSAGTYARLIPQVMHTKPEKVPEYASKISQRIRGALAQMRTILVELQPEALTKTDLGVLLKQLGNAFTGNTGISVKFQVESQVNLRKDVQIAYYRIAQEALHNIEKHANASAVSLSFFDLDHTITLIIEDNGNGFDTNGDFMSQFGLKNMQDRARAIDAYLSIESAPQQGTRISLVRAYTP